MYCLCCLWGTLWNKNFEKMRYFKFFLPKSSVLKESRSSLTFAGRSWVNRISVFHADNETRNFSFQGGRWASGGGGNGAVVSWYLGPGLPDMGGIQRTAARHGPPQQAWWYSSPAPTRIQGSEPCTNSFCNYKRKRKITLLFFVSGGS